MPDIQERLSRAISDRYHILRKLGAGGAASVFLAEDRKLGRRVAIKVMHPELSATVAGPRFFREIRIAAGLAHPNIVPVHDSGEADGLLFFVMRYQEGESLRALLDREGRLTVSRAVSIARDVADGLAYAHAQGVIHRDIKPANILLTGDHALITDFGVARAVEAATAEDTAVTSHAVGTPLYMSPEQAVSSAEIDGRADVYSLGCVLYEMLTGEPLFQGGGAAVVIASHFHKPVPPLRAVRPDVPWPLAETVQRALEKAPERRLESASAMLSSLESFQPGLGGARPGLRSMWRWLTPWTRRGIAAGVSAALLLVVMAVAGELFWPAGPALDPSSMVVLPFRGSIPAPDEEVLLVDASDGLTRQLNRWDSVSAVPQVSLTGIRFDRGFDDPTFERIEDGLGIARDLGAGTLVALRAMLRGDSVLLSADLFDSRTGAQRGRTLEVWGEVQDLASGAADLAYRILGLEGPPSEVARLREQSAVPGALIAYESGRRSLERWELPEAEKSLLNATELDPGFAMAHHLLALARFWQWDEGVVRASVVGDRIALSSGAASRNSSGLPLRDSLHIQAFHSFQAGDYARARALYRTLLERDSTDVFAWILQGGVEYRDKWLTESPSGELLPRSNLNVAMRSLTRAIQLSPGLHGPYHTILDIATLVAEAADRRSAPPFLLPEGDFLAPWDWPETPDRLRAFWPAYLDSLVWFDPSRWASVPEAVAAAGANLMLEGSLTDLRRWAAYEPDQDHPQRDLARCLLFLRSRLRGLQPPARVDSLTTEALEHTARALALSPDTTRMELFILANLRLASGDVGGARTTLRLALDWRRAGADTLVPPMALNVLLFSGRPAEALKLLAPTASINRYIPDSISGGTVYAGDVDPLIRRLEILGATGVQGPTLERALQDLMGEWTAGGDRPNRQVELLQTLTAPRIAVALSRAPDSMRTWVEGLDLPDPLWMAMAAQGEGRAPLLRAALDAPLPEKGIGSRSYLLGRMAQDLGEDLLAVRLFSRMDSLALGIDELDPGWGLLALSYLYRARSYEALGEREAALRFYRRFGEAWSNPDTQGTLAQEARRRMEELTR